MYGRTVKLGGRTRPGKPTRRGSVRPPRRTGPSTLRPNNPYPKPKPKPKPKPLPDIVKK